MAYKRKRFSRKSTRRTRRRTSMRVPRTRALISNNVHHFKRTVQLTGILTHAPGGVAAPRTGAIGFTIGSLPDITDFTTLYDQYRINKIKVEFVPGLSGIDGNPMSTSNLFGLPHLHTVVDYDDANAPSTASQLMQYPGYRRTRGDRTHKRYFTPAIATEVFRSSLSTSYSPKWKAWCDFASTDVPHYGIKYVADAFANSGNQWQWSVYATFYFSCKGVR